MTEVTLVMPAQADYVRLARMASADAGSRAGFDYEEIEDLRIAVTELCHVLLGDGARGTVSLEYRTAAGEVTVVGRADEPGAPVTNDFSEIILGKVVDGHSVRSDGDARVFELTKRGGAPPSS
jgi:serine/threonine-protein kinase RsbW